MTKTDQMKPFGTIKACPACDAKETWGDNYTLGMSVYPIREFERGYRAETFANEERSTDIIVSGCWRCGYVWREIALCYVEEDDED